MFDHAFLTRAERDLICLREMACRAGESFGNAFDLSETGEMIEKSAAPVLPNLRTVAAILGLAVIALIVL